MSSALVCPESSCQKAASRPKIQIVLNYSSSGAYPCSCFLAHVSWLTFPCPVFSVPSFPCPRFLVHASSSVFPFPRSFLFSVSCRQSWADSLGWLSESTAGAPFLVHAICPCVCLGSLPCLRGPKTIPRVAAPCRAQRGAAGEPNTRAEIASNRRPSVTYNPSWMAANRRSCARPAGCVRKLRRM